MNDTGHLVTPKVLLVDDEPDVLDSYEDLLRGEGYSFGRAQSRDEAIRRLDTEGPWDAVLLDERLNGPGGGESAHQLLGKIGSRFPDARTLVITGYARPDLVRAAIAAGAWDYLQKDQFLPDLLPVKVRQAVDAAVQRRLAHSSRADVEAALREARAASLAAPDRNEKGRRLEQTLKFLFQTIDGLEHVRTNRSNETEEIDLVVRNESKDPMLAREGTLWLVECKNWSKPVDPQLLTSFRAKLRDRYGRSVLGIFVAAAGFTRNVEPILLRQSNDKEVVLTITGVQLDAWIDARDRVAWLKDRLEEALLRSGG